MAARGHMHPLLSFQPLRFPPHSIRSASGHLLRQKRCQSARLPDIAPFLRTSRKSASLTCLRWVSGRKIHIDNAICIRLPEAVKRPPRLRPSGDLSDGQSGVSQVRFHIPLRSIRNLTSLTALCPISLLTSISFEG